MNNELKNEVKAKFYKITGKELSDEELSKTCGGNESESKESLMSTIKTYINLDTTTENALNALNSLALGAIAIGVMLAVNDPNTDVLNYFQQLLIGYGITWTGGCTLKN